MALDACERCGARTTGEYELMPFCVHCSENLCDKCMDNGYCSAAGAPNYRHQSNEIEDE